MGLQKFAHYIARKAKSLLEFIEKYESKSNDIFNRVMRNFTRQYDVHDYFSLTIKQERHNDTHDVFLEMYRVLFNENIASYIRPLYQSRAYKQSEFRMTWPWPEGESWFVGGTHTMTGDKYGVFSALDVYAPGGVCSWEGDNSCVENFTPQVTAMHSGKVNKISRCSLKIIHESGWATSYYHLDLLDYPNIQTGIIVKQGDIIGRYAGRYDVALCTGGTSTGPHLHFDLIDQFGKPYSLDGREINGYKVKAGKKSYDRNCNRSYLTKNGRKYCPNKQTILHESMEY